MQNLNATGSLNLRNPSTFSRSVSEKEKEEEMKLQKIPALSILSEQTNVIRAKAGEGSKFYVVQKKVEVTKTVILVRHKIEDGDKENKEDIIVYRSDNGNIRREKRCWSN